LRGVQLQQQRQTAEGWLPFDRLATRIRAIVGDMQLEWFEGNQSESGHLQAPDEPIQTLKIWLFAGRPRKFPTICLIAVGRACSEQLSILF
jgi:hypothetical protein